LQAFAARDPRFDDLSGEFNESYFKQSYGFLSDIKLREKQVFLFLSHSLFICHMFKIEFQISLVDQSNLSSITESISSAGV